MNTATPRGEFPSSSLRPSFLFRWKLAKGKTGENLIFLEGEARASTSRQRNHAGNDRPGHQGRGNLALGARAPGSPGCGLHQPSVKFSFRGR